ncbi:MAG: hypothetical protein GYA21_05570 [Myxococcales bacterium]|nr:hypothetical protein [Myxococcales bacterium]
MRRASRGILLLLLAGPGCDVFISDLGTEGHPCREVGAVNRCDQGLECRDGLCHALAPCGKDEDCPAGEICVGQWCERCADFCGIRNCGANPEPRCTAPCGECAVDRVCNLDGICVPPCSGAASCDTGYYCDAESRLCLRKGDCTPVDGLRCDAAFARLERCDSESRKWLIEEECPAGVRRCDPQALDCLLLCANDGDCAAEPDTRCDLEDGVCRPDPP